jgi:hypothetical protein
VPSLTKLQLDAAQEFASAAIGEGTKTMPESFEA